MNAIQPGLQVAEDEVDERQVLLRYVGIAALRDLREPVALLREVVVARDQSSVVMCVPGCTESSTKPSSDFAERSGATWRRRRPAYRPPRRGSALLGSLFPSVSLRLRSSRVLYGRGQR